MQFESIRVAGYKVGNPISQSHSTSRFLRAGRSGGAQQRAIAKAEYAKRINWQELPRYPVTATMAKTVCSGSIAHPEPRLNAISRSGETQIPMARVTSIILNTAGSLPAGFIRHEMLCKRQPRTYDPFQMIKENSTAGSSRPGLILERLEPCEGKLARRVFRGVERQPLAPTRWRFSAHPIRPGPDPKLSGIESLV